MRDGDVARGEDPRDAGLEALVDEDPVVDRQARGLRQRVRGRRADPDDHEVGVDPRPVGRLDGLDPPPLPWIATTRWSPTIRTPCSAWTSPRSRRPPSRAPLQRHRRVEDHRHVRARAAGSRRRPRRRSSHRRSTTTRFAVPAAVRTPSESSIVRRYRTRPGRRRGPRAAAARSPSRSAAGRSPTRRPRSRTTCAARRVDRRHRRRRLAGQRAARRTTPRRGRRPVAAPRRRAGTPWTGAGGCTADGLGRRTG